MNIQVKKKLSGWWYVAIWGGYIILASTIGSALPADSGAFEWILFFLAVLGSIILKSARSGRKQAIVSMPPPEPTYQEKVEWVNQIYKTEALYDDLLSYLQDVPKLTMQESLAIIHNIQLGYNAQPVIKMLVNSLSFRQFPIEEAKTITIEVSNKIYQAVDEQRKLASTVSPSFRADFEKVRLDIYNKEQDAQQEEERAAQNPRYIPRAVMTEVWNRDGGKCVRCGSQEALEFDHIIPVSLGGSSTANNVQLLCQSCNRSKGNRELG